MPQKVFSNLKANNIKKSNVELNCINALKCLLASFSYVCIYLAFETVKNLVEHILQVWFWVLPRGNGIAKEDEIIDDALGINTDHLAHAPEG